MRAATPLAKMLIVIAAAFLGVLLGLFVAQGNAFAATAAGADGQPTADKAAGNDKALAAPKKKAAKPKVVVIDAGHQTRAMTSTEPIAPGSSQRKMKVTGGTVGCVTRLPEYKLNLQVAKRLRAELEKRGYKVIMVRTKNDVRITNIQRAKVANKAKADAFVRIHANAAGSSGVKGALTIAPASPKYVGAKVCKRSKLCQKVLKCLCKETGAKNRGVMYTNTMTGINWSKVPVTIVEMGFMSNPAEDRKLAKPSYQKKIAAGIADGLDAYFKALKK